MSWLRLHINDCYNMSPGVVLDLAVDLFLDLGQVGIVGLVGFRE
jgi:hypothetical protein